MVSFIPLYLKRVYLVDTVEGRSVFYVHMILAAGSSQFNNNNICVVFTSLHTSIFGDVTKRLLFYAVMLLIKCLVLFKKGYLYKYVSVNK